jgi:hypothetical protein
MKDMEGGLSRRGFFRKAAEAAAVVTALGAEEALARGNNDPKGHDEVRERQAALLREYKEIERIRDDAQTAADTKDEEAKARLTEEFNQRKRTIERLKKSLGM